MLPAWKNFGAEASLWLEITINKAAAMGNRLWLK
jgi:hypothetical protein